MLIFAQCMSSIICCKYDYDQGSFSVYIVNYKEKADRTFGLHFSKNEPKSDEFKSGRDRSAASQRAVAIPKRDANLWVTECLIEFLQVEEALCDYDQ